ncbi:MAG: hypothetical protein IJ324_11125 [Lachnospiraceae bacterium]|nr:hypothetical protein [Lachnospiraceae bacterium]
MGKNLLEEDEFDWDDEESKIAKYGIIIGIIAFLGLLAATFIFFSFLKGDEEPMAKESSAVIVEETAAPTPEVTPEPTIAPTPTPSPTPTVAPTEAPTQEPVPDDPFADMNFREVYEKVTAKEATNLRDMPSQGAESHVLAVLPNGEVAVRIAVSDMGWSKLEYNGEEYYAVSSLLTTDLDYRVVVPEDDGIKTEFTACNEKVSPKIEVNLRKLPSVTNPEATVVVTLKYGEVVNRTGINTDVGWSRVEYNGEVLYCISSYVYVVE